MTKKSIKEFQSRCFAGYKTAVGLPDEYTYFYGNPVNVLVPIETATDGAMVVGAYPSAKFYRIGRITDVPLLDNDSPFSSETYFDGVRVRSIPSGRELNENYLAPLALSRTQCWITDLVKVFLFKPGHARRYGELGISTALETRSRFRELGEKSIRWLVEEIKLASPRVILCLGAEVTSILFSVSEKEAKSYLDGQARDLQLMDTSSEAICLPHPGIIMKDFRSNPWPHRFRAEIIPKAYEELRSMGL